MVALGICIAVVVKRTARVPPAPGVSESVDVMAIRSMHTATGPMSIPIAYKVGRLTADNAPGTRELFTAFGRAVGA